MADENGEVAEAIVAPETVETPEVIPAPEAEAPKSEPKSLGESIRGAVERARGDAEARAEGGQPRAPDGKFAPKAADVPAAVVSPVTPAAAVVEAPARLPKELRSSWGQIPQEARAPIERMTQAFAELEPIRRYDEMARQSGTTLAQALETYTGIENELRQNPLAGLDRICQNMGLDLRQVAAHIVGQPHDVNAETAQLRQEVARLRQVEQQYNGFQQTVQHRATADAEAKVQRFAAEHPRFEELTSVIGWALQSGLALDQHGQPSLPLAYEYAERLRPAPQPVAQTHGTPARAPAPERAKLSMQGAPGSTPAAVKSSGSIAEAVASGLARARASL